MSGTQEVYAYTFQWANKTYRFTSFHKSRTRAKLEFFMLWLFGEPWGIREVTKEEVKL